MLSLLPMTEIIQDLNRRKETYKSWKGKNKDDDLWYALTPEEFKGETVFVNYRLSRTRVYQIIIDVTYRLCCSFLRTKERDDGTS